MVPPGAHSDRVSGQNSPFPPAGSSQPEDAALPALGPSLALGITSAQPQDFGWSQGPGAPQVLCVCGLQFLEGVP